MVLHTSFVAPKPATAPTFVSAKLLLSIAEETENDSEIVSTSSADSPVEVVSKFQETAPESIAGSEVADVDAEPHTSQAHGCQAPTCPATILRLPNC